MRFETIGNPQNPAVLFFHAMGVTGASSEPVARNLQERYFCILPTSTVYCAGQTYAGKADEVRQVEEFLRSCGVTRLALVVASSIGADLAMAFLTQTQLPVEHVFFDGGQFAQIGKSTRLLFDHRHNFVLRQGKGLFRPGDPVGRAQQGSKNAHGLRLPFFNGRCS